MSFEIPILFCIYNRPDVTARTFEVIAKQKPRNLLIAGDGPRKGRPGDVEQVERTRQVIQEVDWDCNLQACFSNENLGCRKQMARAISWGFDLFDQLIILEDDCLANASFFPYCQQLLHRYAECPEVMTIAGINHLPLPCQHDYRFSKYPLIWGWASWRRAWRHYDLEMKKWNSTVTQAKVLDRFAESIVEREYWRGIFEAQSKGQIDTWDYSWTFANWLHEGLTIVPRKNLVSNIGFGSLATHTLDGKSKLANFPSLPLQVSLHPQTINQDKDWDRAAREFYFPEPAISLDTTKPPLQTRSRKSIFSRVLRRYREGKAA